MPKITGTFVQADGSPATGVVEFAPSVAVGDGPTVLLPAPCSITLDHGSFAVTLPATDDPAYTPAGWVWQATERIRGGREPYFFTLTADADYWDLLPVVEPDSYLPWTFTASATTGLPGTDADVDVTGDPPAPVFEFVIPRGDKGDTGSMSVAYVPAAPAAPAVGDVWVDSDGAVETYGAPFQSADIADGAIIGSKIADGAVTTGKLAANAAVVVSTTAPASPVIGLLWVDTDG